MPTSWSRRQNQDTGTLGRRAVGVLKVLEGAFAIHGTVRPLIPAQPRQQPNIPKPGVAKDKSTFLGGGFKYFLFSPLFGEMIDPF